LAAIGDGSQDNWEIFQFQSADLVAPGRYELSGACAVNWAVTL